MTDTGIFVFGLFTVFLLGLGLAFTVYEVHHPHH